MSDVLLGVLIGGGLTLLGTVGVELVKGKFESSLDKEKRADNRRLDRDLFQRETLRKLQDAMYEFAMSGVKIHAARVRAANAGLPWERSWEDELSEANLKSGVAMETLRSRVDDEQVRDLAGELLRVLGEMINAEGRPNAELAFARVGELEDAFNDRAGELIRQSFSS